MTPFKAARLLARNHGMLTLEARLPCGTVLAQAQHPWQLVQAIDAWTIRGRVHPILELNRHRAVVLMPLTWHESLTEGEAAALDSHLNQQ